MKKILEAIEQNPELKAKIEALDKDPKAQPEDFVAVLKEYDIEISADDFKPAVPSDELSDDELDAVAGGYSCNCIVGGGGTPTPDTGDKTCACVVYGQGDYTRHDGETVMRCQCPFAGHGY